VLFSLFILLNPLSIFKTIGLVVVSIVSTPHFSRFHPTFPIWGRLKMGDSHKLTIYIGK
jgi:hypothetical protein